MKTSKTQTGNISYQSVLRTMPALCCQNPTQFQYTIDRDMVQRAKNSNKKYYIGNQRSTDVMDEAVREFSGCFIHSYVNNRFEYISSVPYPFFTSRSEGQLSNAEKSILIHHSMNTLRFFWKVNISRNLKMIDQVSSENNGTQYTAWNQRVFITIYQMHVRESGPFTYLISRDQFLV